MKRFSFGWLVVIVAGALLAGNPAWSQAERRFSVKVTVAEISDAAGKIDKRAKRLDLNLRKKFKYNSLKVIKERHLKLRIDEVGSVKLPGGRMFRVRRATRRSWRHPDPPAPSRCAPRYPTSESCPASGARRPP